MKGDKIGLGIEPAGQVQHDEAMHHGPENLAECLGIAGEISLGDQVLDVSGHGLPRAPPGADEIRKALGFGLIHVEHQLVGIGLTEREIEISAADRVGSRRRTALDRGGLFERGGETVEGGGAHGRQDFIFVLKIAIRGHGADPEFARQFPHRHRLRPALGKQPFGNHAKPVAKRFYLGARKVARHNIQCKFTS